MDSKTRQILLEFLELLAESELEQVDESTLRILNRFVDEQLVQTEIFDTAARRLSNTKRYIQATELGSASFEIRCLVNDMRRLLES